MIECGWLQLRSVYTWNFSRRSALSCAMAKNWSNDWRWPLNMQVVKFMFRVYMDCRHAGVAKTLPLSLQGCFLGWFPPVPVTSLEVRSLRFSRCISRCDFHMWCFNHEKTSGIWDSSKTKGTYHGYVVVFLRVYKQEWITMITLGSMGLWSSISYWEPKNHG